MGQQVEQRAAPDPLRSGPVAEQLEHFQQPEPPRVITEAAVLLHQLQEQFQAGAFQRLAIFSTPGMMKILNEEMPEELTGAIVLEESRDLMRLSERDLRKAVAAALSAKPGN